MSMIPCHRGGHHCSWPACSQDCDGRPARGSTPPRKGETQMEIVFQDGTYWIIENTDHCDEDGNHDMTSRVLAVGLATYDDAWHVRDEMERAA